jgi:predicted permease
MLSDLRYSLRQLARAPGFTAVVVLSLALGIGANTTVLSWIRHILQRPLPGVVRQEEIVALTTREGGGNLSLLDSRDLDQLRDCFAGVAVSQITPASLTLDRDPEWTYGQIASANFFALLGVQPILGRTFLPDEDLKPGGNPVLILGEKLWRRRFGADPGVVGRVVDLNRHKFTVIGVVPAAFSGTMTGVACEFWAPVSMVREVASWPEDYITWRGSRPFHNVARLQPGVTLAQAQAAVSALDARLAELYPRSNRETRHRIVPYAAAPFGAQSILGPALRLMLAVSLGVLLIVAANVANLLLARAASRRKEIAIRIAAGASRGRIVRLLLVESLVLALLGGVGGILVASWAVDGIAAFLPAGPLPIAIGGGLDAATLGLTVALTLATGLVFGLVPALSFSSPRLYETLKEGGRTSAGGAAHHRIRHGLVIAEIALALVLLVGASLCLKGLRRAQQVDFGFAPDHVLTSGLQIGMNGYTEQTGLVFYRRLQERLAGLPSVETAALASWFPLGLEGCKGHGVQVDGYERREGENPTVEYARISSDYFAAMRIPLVAGRDFNAADTGDAPAVAIVNEHFAAHYWPGLDALGRTFRCAGRERTIVGIARAGKYRALDEPAHPFFYLPCTQGAPELDLGLCLRVKGDPAAAIEAVRQTVRALDPGVDLWGARPLTQHIQGAFFAQRIASAMLAGLGLVALALAAMGVYAVMAYAVGQRTQEFGVRLALGAQPVDVLWQVLRRGLWLAALGVAAGLGLALAVTRLLAGFLYGVSPFDFAIFTGVPLLLVAIALLACYIPARRATRVDPMIALRTE